MVIEPVEVHLGTLSLGPLRALTPTRDTYTTLLLQPAGPIVGSRERIGNADGAAASRFCSNFLEKAVQEFVDLVVVPEYCLPWDVVDGIWAPASALRPAEGAIWVLGCESIKPAALVDVVQRMRAAGCFVHHEALDPAEIRRKVYIDPLVYVFWCIDAGGAKVLCFFIQFKTTPCRDVLDVEQLSLYLGQKVYSFNRGLNQIGLISIICSDAFAFTNELVDDNHANCLLIHIQLNQKPAHSVYAAYRAWLCSVASRNHVELLCLNWSGEVLEQKGDGHVQNWQNNAGSAWYAPPAKFGLQEDHILEAHRAGLYYNLIAGRWHAFFLNSQPHALLLRKQKVLVHGVPQALMTTSCVVVQGRWVWGKGVGAWVAEPAPNDGFNEALTPYLALPGQLAPLTGTSPIAVERALELLVGPSTKPESWYHIDVLECMHVAAQESIRRITVNQERDPQSLGIQYRKDRLQRAQDAATLPGHGVPWPPALKDLEGGFSFQWNEATPHHNVRATISGASAALVYLADQSDDGIISKVYAFLSQAMIQHAVKVAMRDGADLEKAVVEARDRICLVYKRDHAPRVWGSEHTSRIDLPPDSSSVSITGEPA